MFLSSNKCCSYACPCCNVQCGPLLSDFALPLLILTCRAPCFSRHGCLDTNTTKSENNQSDQHVLILSESIVLIKINIRRELNQKKMWLPSHHALRVFSWARQHCPSAWETASDPTHPQPTYPPHTIAPPTVPSFFPRPTQSLRRASSASTRPQTPWHAQVSSSRPSTGLPATCVQPSLGLNCGAERKQSEEEEPRKRWREGWEGAGKKGGGGESDAWTTVELQRLALRNRPVHRLAGVSSRNRTPTNMTNWLLSRS